MGSRDAPWCPPIVEMSGGMVGHLLAWEMHERDGSWHAWVSWIQETGSRHVHKVVAVRAGSLQPLEHPDAYSAVPRRVRGRDGLIKPWSGESGLRLSPADRTAIVRYASSASASGATFPATDPRDDHVVNQPCAKCGKDHPGDSVVLEDQSGNAAAAADCGQPPGTAS